MAIGDDRLWAISDKAGATSYLSAEELAYAEAHLKSSLPQDRANACEAILRCSQSQVQRAAAGTTLEELCLKSVDEDYVVAILTALMYYARTDVYSDPIGIRNFVIRSGGSPKYYIRANAVDLLQVLAKGGDAEALRLLRSLASDEHAAVRENATISLKRLGG